MIYFFAGMVFAIVYQIGKLVGAKQTFDTLEEEGKIISKDDLKKLDDLKKSLDKRYK